MVAQLDHEPINKLSRSHFDSLTPGQQLTQILKALQENDEELVHLIKRNQIDINAFGDDPASGTVTVTNPMRQPIMVTDILATWNPSTALPNAGQAIFSEGSVTSPGAFGGITSTVSLPAGRWQVTAQFYLSGTIAAPADQNNVELTWGAAANAIIAYPAIANQVFTFTTQVNLAAAHTITMQTIGAGTVGSVYTGDINATPIASNAPTSATITFGGRTYQLNYSSGFFQATSLHGLQLDNTASQGNAMVLTVSPPVAAHLEFAGYCDYRKDDRL